MIQEIDRVLIRFFVVVVLVLVILLVGCASKDCIIEDDCPAHPMMNEERKPERRTHQAESLPWSYERRFRARSA